MLTVALGNNASFVYCIDNTTKPCAGSERWDEGHVRGRHTFLIASIVAVLRASWSGVGILEGVCVEKAEEEVQTKRRGRASCCLYAHASSTAAVSSCCGPKSRARVRFLLGPKRQTVCQAKFKAKSEKDSRSQQLPVS